MTGTARKEKKTPEQGEHCHDVVGGNFITIGRISAGNLLFRWIVVDGAASAANEKPGAAGPVQFHHSPGRSSRGILPDPGQVFRGGLASHGGGIDRIYSHAP